MRHKPFQDMSFFEHTVIEMTKALITAERGAKKSYEAISREAVDLADLLINELEKREVEERKKWGSAFARRG